MIEIKGFWKFVVFCFVGGTSALIHFTIYVLFFEYILKSLINVNILIFGASINHIIAYIMGVAVSIVYNFSMNRNITFNAKHERVKKQLPKYLSVYAISIGVGFVVSIVIINFIGENGINPLIATAAGILASIPISFLGSLLWTFRKNRTIGVN